ncbi:hypothetical protein H2248_001543 [Termitomyces sp. 'cryptogamus']|nr:hypothetical protein H2248_001543 [Termitomyces sp. 'cryptogamus']
MMETSIRFGLTDSIQASISHGIQADLIRKIFEQASVVSTGATATEDITPDDKVPILQQSGDGVTLEPSIEPKEKSMGLTVTGNGKTATTSYCDENQVPLSSPPRTPSRSFKYESESGQEDSLTLSSSDPVQTHVFDASYFSSSNTYRNTSSFYHLSVDRIPVESVPPKIATPPLNRQAFDMTELSPSTVLPMHHLALGKRSISAPASMTFRTIVVHLHDEPDSPLKKIKTWDVRSHSTNVFRQELWDADYRWYSDSNGSVAFMAHYRALPWELLEPFVIEGGRETRPFVLFRTDLILQ